MGVLLIKLSTQFKGERKCVLTVTKLVRRHAKFHSSSCTSAHDATKSIASHATYRATGKKTP